MARIEERLRFERDGTVTALSGKMEYGQGLRAAYPRLVAEEMGIPVDRVRVVLGDPDRTPWDMGTFGSLSIEMDGQEIRRAAACARGLLLERAARQWGCSATDVTISDGTVRASDGRAVDLVELAMAEPVAGEIPEVVPLASPTPTCPDGPLSPDGIALVTGRLEFAGDVHLPGMLHGMVLHPALHRATLLHVDRTAALAVPGVVAVVEEPEFTGVVAERQDQALAALAALSPEWGLPRPSPSDPLDIALRSDPGVDAALESARTHLHRSYFTPHIAGSPLGPSVGIADVRPDAAIVYGTTQVPFRLRDEVARITGLPATHVHFRPKAMSGGFGRHGSHDAAVEAVRLSKAVGRPVQVQWRRVDELRAGPNRPEMNATLDAALDSAGRIEAWRATIRTQPYSYDAGTRPDATLTPRPGPGVQGSAEGGSWGSPAGMAAMMAGRNGVPPYEIPRAAISLQVVPAKLRTGALRSLAASPNTFATESFIDELAYEVGADPIAFRLAHINDPRLRRVLETVRERSGWQTGRRGRGLGVACVVYRRTYVAEVVEVTVDPSGRVRVERVCCAVDPGHVVHPDGARNQVEGAVQMAASWTLIEELPHHEREVTGATWEDYPIATCLDAPRAIDVVFTGDDLTPSAGLGEPPAVPTAAAIANAVFDACGARVRELPIRPDSVRRALPDAR